MHRAGTDRARPVSLPHVSALDGLRGVAVAAVLLFHGGVSWASGGFVGVEVFFVLSGFLITSLLVTEWADRATIVLRAFWARRARRLLPALFALVLVIGIFYALAGPSRAVPGMEDDGISTLLYFNNWHQILDGANYFAASGPVSPFQHTWSLAIEEQFYVIWPLVVLAVLGLAHRRGASGRRALQCLLAAALLGAVASAIDAALLFHGGRDLNRVYYGTDTRANGLLLGAALAIGLAIRTRYPLSRPRLVLTTAGRAVLQFTALAALAALGAAIGLLSGSTSWLYPYGMLAVDAAAATVILGALVTPRGPVPRLLSLTPVRGLGMISYGLYLWHFPLFVWLDESSTGQHGWSLLVLRLGASVAVSLVSYVLIEQPIRRRRRPVWMIRTLAPVGAGAAFCSLVVAAAAASLPATVPVAQRLPTAPRTLRGSDGPCTKTLSDTQAYGLAPLAPARETKFEYESLGTSQIRWSGSARRTFTTCPPKRVMVIGDSIAFTIGVPMMDNEQEYGVELANAASLGCSFATRGQLNVDGKWQSPPVGCPGALSTWAADARELHAQEVVVQLGYRDEFDWRWGTRVVHLGQPAFDAYVRRQIDRYVQVLGRHRTKILFLGVPYAHPPDQADGSPAPAASPARHALINAMLEREARLHPRTVSVVDIDRTISPGNRYAGRIDGQLCRFDGIHFTVFCSKLMEPSVLGAARRLLGG